MYEGNDNQATVNYPEDFKLLTEHERREESDYLDEVSDDVPSPTFKKAIQKRIAKITLGTKVSTETMDKIDKEIEAASATMSDPELILQSQEAGLVSDDLASKLLGFPEGEAKKAAEDHAERLARIAIAQAKGGGEGANAPGARGVPAADPNPKAAKDEKKASRDTTKDPTAASKVRGKGL